MVLLRRNKLKRQRPHSVTVQRELTDHEASVVLARAESELHNYRQKRLNIDQLLSKTSYNLSLPLDRSYLI